MNHQEKQSSVEKRQSCTSGCLEGGAHLLQMRSVWVQNAAAAAAASLITHKKCDIKLCIHLSSPDPLSSSCLSVSLCTKPLRASSSSCLCAAASSYFDFALGSTTALLSWCTCGFYVLLVSNALLLRKRVRGGEEGEEGRGFIASHCISWGSFAVKLWGLIKLTRTSNRCYHHG